MKKVDLGTIKQKIGFFPFEFQKEILKNQNQFTVVVGGKRVGKTILAAYIALRELFLYRKSIWIIAPTHDLTSRIWEYLDLWIETAYSSDEKSSLFRINKHEHIIENVMTKSKLWTKTGENPTSLLGKGLNLAVIDEASRLGNGLWKGYIEPNLMDRRGRAFFISNPYGFNWFYDLYLMGTEDKVNNPYISFHVPTVIEDKNENIVGSNNPILNIDMLQSIKDSTPSDIWRQEYLAAFQEGVGQRFKNYESCIDDTIRIKDVNEWLIPPESGHLYLMGVDLAKVEDFTVLTIMDRMTNRMVGFWRVNRIDWAFIKEKIKRLASDYNNATVTVDTTGGASEVFAEDLRLDSVDVADFVYTNKAKIQLIDKLGNLMQAGKIKFPKIPQLIQEIRSFTYHFSTSGNLIYGSSKKDDCVNSLALACWELNEEPLEETTSRSLWIPQMQKYS